MTMSASHDKAGGLPPAAVESFWLETARSMARESVNSIEEAAKQVIAIASVAQTVYFAAISFSRLRMVIGRLAPMEQIIVALALISPLVCWVFALYFAIRVFKPEMYRTDLSSADRAEEMHYRVVAYKHQQLQRAYWFLVLGFIPLLVNVMLSFFVV